MKYGVKQRMMWLIFQESFKRQVIKLLVEEDARQLMKQAKRTYRDILKELPEFDEKDRFLMNILSASMLGAIYMNLKHKPDLETMTEFYHQGMSENTLMRFYLKHSNAYTKKAQRRLRKQAEFSQRIDNPYSWKFSYQAGKDVNEYTAIFSTCGICALFSKLKIEEITPAMCTYDYNMAELSGSIFTRQYTLADGGPHCDCHYQKK